MRKAARLLLVLPSAVVLCGLLTSSATAAINPAPGSPFTSPVSGGSIAVNPSGTLLAEVGGSQTVAVFSVGSDGGLTPVSGSPFSTGAGTSPVSAAFSPDGRLLATANTNGKNMSVFAVSSNGSLKQVVGSPFASDQAGNIGAGPWGVAFSPDGKWLVAEDLNFATISVYSVSSTGALTKAVGSPFATGDGGPYSMAFSPDGKWLAAAGGHVDMFSFDDSTGALSPVSSAALSSGEFPRDVAFSPGGTFLAAVEPDISVFTVNSSSGALTQIPGSPFPTHASSAGQNSIAYSPNGRLIATGGTSSSQVGVYGVDAATGAPTPVVGSPFPVGGSDGSGQVLFGAKSGLLASADYFAGLSTFTVTSTMAPGAISGLEGNTIEGIVANDDCALSGTDATLQWGDGAASSSIPVKPGGAIQSSHTFSDEGAYSGQVTLSDPCGDTGTTLTTTVADAPLTLRPDGVNATAGLGFTGQLGSFTDANPLAGAGDFSASVDWGDGQSSPATVEATGGAFSVNAAHTYARHGSYLVTLRVQDRGGASATGQAAATVAVNPLPPPVLGKKVNLFPGTGTVLVKPAGKGTSFEPLFEPRQVAIGSEIDTRNGTMTLITATTRRHITQSGQFFGSRFSVDQSGNKLQKGLTTLTLTGTSYASCGVHPLPDAVLQNPWSPLASVAHSATVLQTLHASERSGHFRTRGRYSAATVRGTVWDTVERCDGTLTIVHRGVVAVKDFRRHTTITLTAGRSYLARAR